MKKFILFVLPLILATVVFVGSLFYLQKDSGKGALQVTSTPQSKVYLNGTPIGQTPLCKCEAPDMLVSGDYAIRLVPPGEDFAPFEQKITITKSVLTVVDRSFGNGAKSSGSLITLTPLDDKKSLGVLFVSFPEKADVYIDNTYAGSTPLSTTNVTESDHEVTIKKEGYTDKAIRIRAILGYRLEASVFLSVSDDALSLLHDVATQSAVSLPQTTKIIIRETPTGFLRVRTVPTLSGEEIAQVTPGQSFDLLDEKDLWYQIKLSDGRTGWVSGQYAQKK